MTSLYNEHGVVIRSASLEDADAIAVIYNWYVRNTCFTFEESPTSGNQIRQKLERMNAVHPWIVLEQAGDIKGFAYAGEFRARAAYRNSVETTVYLDQSCRGKGFGSLLYKKLVEMLANSPVHVLIAVIALPNAASVALHEKLGFVKVGQLEEVGQKFDKWIDTGYWQLVFRDGR